MKTYYATFTPDDKCWTALYTSRGRMIQSRAGAMRRAKELGATRIAVRHNDDVVEFAKRFPGFAWRSIPYGAGIPDLAPSIPTEGKGPIHHLRGRHIHQGNE